MENSSRKILALLGPTNTGKTHAAIENWPKGRARTRSKRQTLRRPLSNYNCIINCKIVI